MKILVATDGSEQARNALAYAANICDQISVMRWAGRSPW